MVCYWVVGGIELQGEDGTSQRPENKGRVKLGKYMGAISVELIFKTEWKSLPWEKCGTEAKTEPMEAWHVSSRKWQRGC